MPQLALFVRICLFALLSGPVSSTEAAKPTLASANKASDSTLTGWTTAVAANSVMRFSVDSCSGITAATLSLTVTKT